MVRSLISKFLCHSQRQNSEHPVRKKEFEQIEIFHPEINRDAILAMNHFKYLKFSYTVPQSVIHPPLGTGSEELISVRRISAGLQESDPGPLCKENFGVIPHRVEGLVDTTPSDSCAPLGRLRDPPVQTNNDIMQHSCSER